MNVTAPVTGQVVVMAILIAIGFILNKTKLLTKSGTAQMSSLLVTLVTPCVMIQAFQTEFNLENINRLITGFALTIVFHLFAISFVKLLFIKSKKSDETVCDKFCSVYSNCGFMGIPLLQAVLGNDGVFIGSTYLAIFNVFVWTHGYYSFAKGTDSFPIRKAFLNPGVIGITIALILYFCRISLPGVLASVVGGINSLNTPVAMILLGVYLGESDLLSAIKKPKIYLVSFLRLLCLPILFLLLLKVMNIEHFVTLSIVLSAGCPCAAISAIFSAQFGKDTGYASSIVTMSTLMSLLTLPLLAAVASLIL